MKRIEAIWEKGTWVEGESLQMCSASEQNEMFLVGAKWEYELPKGYAMFKTPPKMGEFLEVVGEKDGTEVLLGYACQVVYVLWAQVFSSFEECCDSPFFHPSSYIVCRMEDVDAAVKRQAEDECFGD
jgi:hypothetical protein